MNYHKFMCTYRGSGRFSVAGGMYSYGQTFILPDSQAIKFMKSEDFRGGNIAYLGEIAADSGDFSTNAVSALDGKWGTEKFNILPVSTVSIIPTTTAGVNGAGTQGQDLSAGFKFGRRVIIDKFLAKTPVATTVANAPRLLVTAGDPVKASATTLRYYDNSATTYGAMVNGSIAAAAPIAWAANDLMIVGCTSKFRSAQVTCGTAATANATIDAVYYWNGSAWTAFSGYVDYTIDRLTANPDSFGRTDANSTVRVVWWDAPSDWAPGGPSGSGCRQQDYCVALRVSGALTTLATGSIYPLLDKPIADIHLGQRGTTFDAVLTEIGGTWIDETNDAASAATGDVGLQLLGSTDYIYLGCVNPFGGLDFVTTVAATAALASTSEIYYWNGLDWSSAATVLTDAWGSTVTDNTVLNNSPWGQDGQIAFTGTPTDWMPDVATNVDEISAALTAGTLVLNGGADGSVPLYWLKVTATQAVVPAATAAQIFALPSTRGFMEFDAAPFCAVDADETLHVCVVDENTTVTVSLQAVVADI